MKNARFWIKYGVGDCKESCNRDSDSAVHSWHSFYWVDLYCDSNYNYCENHDFDTKTDIRIAGYMEAVIAEDDKCLLALLI